MGQIFFKICCSGADLNSQLETPVTSRTGARLNIHGAEENKQVTIGNISVYIDSPRTGRFMPLIDEKITMI